MPTLTLVFSVKITELNNDFQQIFKKMFQKCYPKHYKIKIERTTTLPEYSLFKYIVIKQDLTIFY